MDLLSLALDFVLHLDKHLAEFCAAHGAWTYGLLYAIVFAETGFVVTPFLPGDSLLFAAGALAGSGALSITAVFGVLASAAILGDNLNYWVGRLLGRRLVARYPRLIKREHLERTHAFFERYGGKTVIMARFVPIVRTFAPFVAGLGAMTYRRFVCYDLFGGLLWVGVCTLAGYWFGGREIVRNNFSLVVLAIIVISVLPAVVEFWRARRAARRPAAEPADQTMSAK
jgi:membrane-associated protein